MSIAAALLLAGALGIMILMHLVGHESHGASHGAHESDEKLGKDETSAPGGPKAAASSRGRHGCC
jgi:hypothetical protein